MESYLALRQQLKQSIRAQMQRDSGSVSDSIGGDSHNNYGCFFGPSETVLTGNAVQEISNLWSKYKTGEIDFKKNYATAKPTAMRKRKVQRFKDSRDYSFLSSSCEGEICTATYTPPQKRDLISKKKPIKLIVKLGGSVITKNPTKSGGQKSNYPSRAKKEESKESSVSVTVSKQQRPEQKKKKKEEGEGQERKAVEKRQREEDKLPEKKKKKKEEEGEGKERRPVEKRENLEDEGNVAINLIREMFGYDPTAFSDDDEEELKMEASFADIQKEERRSAKIATREDRQELRKLETAESCRKATKRKFII